MLGLDFFAAFLAGVLSVLPACGPALLPVFFAYSLGRRSGLIRATLIFISGFSIIFIPFGLGVNLLSNFLIQERDLLYKIAGIIFIIFGIGLWFRFSPNFHFTLNSKKIFVLGLTLGLTSSSCSAPVFGAILTLAATGQNLWRTFAYLLVFEVGIIVPLLLLAYIFDRIRFQEMFRYIRLLNFLSGLFFIILGLSFVLGFDYLGLLGQRLGIIDWATDINLRLLK